MSIGFVTFVERARHALGLSDLLDPQNTLASQKNMKKNTKTSVSVSRRLSFGRSRKNSPRSSSRRCKGTCPPS